MVSAPVPMSVAPIIRLKEPSSLILIMAPPMSTPGMADPCMAMAPPTPRTLLPLPWRLPCFSRQPMLCIPRSAHSARPQEYSSWEKPSLPSFMFLESGLTSPTRTQFFARKSIGSRPRARATSSMCDSAAKAPWGTP